MRIQELQLMLPAWGPQPESAAADAPLHMEPLQGEEALPVQTEDALVVPDMVAPAPDAVVAEAPVQASDHSH
eukprot:5794987-Karenia_brevis.AAC.1